MSLRSELQGTVHVMTDHFKFIFVSELASHADHKINVLLINQSYQTKHLMLYKSEYMQFPEHLFIGIIL